MKCLVDRGHDILAHDVINVLVVFPLGLGRQVID